MPQARDLDARECTRLLREQHTGRVALATPDGPHIVPVPYTVLEDTIVVRTSSYSVLGSYGRDAMLAFEVHHHDPADRHGWSVVARGRAWAVTDPEETALVRSAWPVTPGSAAKLNVLLRFRWSTLTGRSVLPTPRRCDELSAGRALTAL